MNNFNLFTWRMVIKLSATFVFALFVFTSCKKKDTSLGVKSIDQNELLNSAMVDTFSLITYSEPEDSTITSSPYYALLGTYNDPLFGPSEASFYTQLRLATPNPQFGDLSAITIDSFVLGLEYAGFYGDLSQKKVEVYRLTDTMNVITTYYSFSTKDCYQNDLVDPNHNLITPNPYDSTIVAGVALPAQMRIFLDTNLARTIMNDAASNPDYFASNDNFLNYYFKGIHVKVNNPPQTSGNGGILYFDMTSKYTKLTIYYKQEGLSKTYDIVSDSYSATFNNIHIDNTGKQVSSVIHSHILGQNQFYSQSAKSRAVINIPGINNLPSKAIIHEAMLILPVEYQTGYKYTPADEISIATRLQDGTTGLYNIGAGIYDPFQKQYTFDLRSYVQGVISQQRFPVYVSGMLVNALIKGTEIYVNPKLFNTSCDRIVFNGVNTTNKKKPKLILKYTEF